MGKYEPLTRFLSAQTSDRIEMSFEQIEKTLGFKLPKSAHEHDPFWVNNPKGHVHAQAWLAAGFETTGLNRRNRRVTFCRVRPDLARRLKDIKSFRAKGPQNLTHDIVAMIREDRDR
jgi:hypothetical protein